MVFLLFAVLKVIFQCVQLVWVLCAVDGGDVLVQNPPSIPVLALVRLITWFRGYKMIVDWHNLGFSVLGVNLNSIEHANDGKKKQRWSIFFLKKIAEWYERFFGVLANSHICVTKAMMYYLATWGIEYAFLFECFIIFEQM